MFKVVFVFSLIVASAADQDKSHSKLSRHTEVSKLSNRTNQTITESFGNPIIDSLKMQKETRGQQTRQAGKDPFIWFSKWSLTNHSCPSSVQRPLKQTKAPYKNEDLVMSVSALVDRSPNKFEKLVEVEKSHSKGKRKTMIPGSDSELSLLDDWREDKVKASHISHIYIGESLYPYIYEESRVFQSEPPKPSSGENNSHLKEVELSETRRKKEEEVPVYEITKIYEIK